MTDMKRLEQLRNLIATQQTTPEEQLAYVELLHRMGAIETTILSRWKWMARKKQLEEERRRILDSLVFLGRLIQLEHTYDRALVGVGPTR